MHYLKRVFLGAAISLLSLSCSFSAFAGTPDTEDSFFEPTGPGVCQEEEDADPVPQEISLGEFTVTGYCGCSKCSGGWGLTYSGTVPTPDHTISADLEQFLLGTKLKINGSSIRWRTRALLFMATFLIYFTVPMKHLIMGLTPRKSF